MLKDINPHKKITEEQWLSLFDHLELDNEDIKIAKDYYKIYESIGSVNDNWFEAGKTTQMLFAIKEGEKILNKQK